MKLLTILTVLVAATPASARNIMNWECGPDKITVDLTFTAPWKTDRHYYNHEITIIGLRDPIKDRVTFKPVTKDGHLRAYLNGKPCREIPYPPPEPAKPPEADSSQPTPQPN